MNTKKFDYTNVVFGTLIFTVYELAIWSAIYPIAVAQAPLDKKLEPIFCLGFMSLCGVFLASHAVFSLVKKR